MEQIEIALAANDKYFPGLLTTAYSIYLSASADVILSFHILETDISSEHIQILEKSLTSRPNGPRTVIQKHHISEDLFPDYFPTWYGNKLAYARFLLPEILPHCNHVIYCDVDFLWLADITELWKLKSSGDILYGVQDIEWTHSTVNNWMARKGYPEFQHYFCSGLSFYNLDAFRNEKIIEQTFDFLKKHPDIPWCDQTAMNYVLRDRIRFIDQKWMTLTSLFTRDKLLNNIVVHFAGCAPWKNGNSLVIPYISPLEILWHRYYAKAMHTSVYKSLRANYSARQIILSLTILFLCSNVFMRNIIFKISNSLGLNAYTGLFSSVEHYTKKKNAHIFNPFFFVKKMTK